MSHIPYFGEDIIAESSKVAVDPNGAHDGPAGRPLLPDEGRSAGQAASGAQDAPDTDAGTVPYA